MYPFEDIVHSEDGGSLSARCMIEPGQPWFNGHFPGRPIMPAVAQIQMIEALLEKHSHWLGKVTGGTALKFLKPIAPGDCIELQLNKMHEDRIGFTLHRGGTLTTKGVLIIDGDYLE